MMHESDAARLWGNTIRRHVERVSTPREQPSARMSWVIIFGVCALMWVLGAICAVVWIGKGVVH